MQFLKYNDSYFEHCLQLFDENCPEYFAENEKNDYTDFLQASGSNYFIGKIQNSVICAFGVIPGTDLERIRLSWIMVSPKNKDKGVGRKMMNHVQELATKSGSSVIEIAASHLSAPFFTKFGAKELLRTEHGWGADMHRVDMQIKL